MDRNAPLIVLVWWASNRRINRNASSEAVWCEVAWGEKKRVNAQSRRLAKSDTSRCVYRLSMLSVL